MDELDQILDNVSVSRRWFAYGISLGKTKSAIMDKPAATILVSVYRDKWDVMQRKFEGDSISQAMEEFKKWIDNPDYIQSSVRPGSIDEKEQPKKKKLPPATLFS